MEINPARKDLKIKLMGELIDVVRFFGAAKTRWATSLVLLQIPRSVPSFVFVFFVFFCCYPEPDGSTA